MKKSFALIAVLMMFVLGTSTKVVAQDQAGTKTEQVAQPTPAPDAAVDKVEAEASKVEENKSLHSVIKEKFIQGGPEFMASILICLILGLAFSIERIIYLNLATTNTKKLLSSVEDAFEKGGVEAAKEVCRNTRGPVASIFYQGLMRYNEGPEVVEKSVVSYGGVQASLLEKGLSWIGLFISLAPMLGFLGTVIGLIIAFDAIEVAGDISPALIANGMKIALITTVFGLIVAMILQVFYNYFLAKIESIVVDMEDSSISLLDMVVKFSAKTSK